MAQEPPLCARHRSELLLRRACTSSLPLLIFGAFVLCLIPSGVRGEAGDAAGWVREPHGLEVRHPRQRGRKPKLTPQSPLLDLRCPLCLAMSGHTRGLFDFVGLSRCVWFHFSPT